MSAESPFAVPSDEAVEKFGDVYAGRLNWRKNCLVVGGNKYLANTRARIKAALTAAYAVDATRLRAALKDERT